MAIFSRRTIQRLINENAEFLKPKQSKTHVNKLNKCDESFIDTEWEVVLLNAFSKLGTVIHEPELKGTNPDIHFTAHSTPSESFIADIATLTDKGLSENYPVEAFRNELMDIVLERGLRGDSFYLEIDTNYHGVFRGGARPTLKLPTKLNFKRLVFNEKFYEFLDEIADAPDKHRSYKVKTESIGIVINYNPQQLSSITSHLSYTLITSLIQNTLYNSLEKKAGKLVGTNCGLPLGIIVCDGGYSMFNRERRWDSYGFDDVIGYFLQSYPSISFVMTFTVEQSFGYKARSKIHTNLYEGISFSNLGNAVLSSLSKVHKRLPVPQRDAKNAVYYLRSARPHRGDSFAGGLEGGSNYLKISARAVLELLAGKITQEQFSDIHSYNPFANEVEDGHLINGIEFEQGDNEKDDDWLVFKFGSADAAISPFTIPKK